MDDFDQILENGIVFKGASKGGPKDDGKVKTKAKKKKYITGVRKPSTVSSGPIASHSTKVDTRDDTMEPVSLSMGLSASLFVYSLWLAAVKMVFPEQRHWVAYFRSVLRRIRLRIQKSGTPEGNSAMIISCLKED